jgi:hypothetical protein
VSTTTACRSAHRTQSLSTPRTIGAYALYSAPRLLFSPARQTTLACSNCYAEFGVTATVSLDATIADGFREAAVLVQGSAVLNSELAFRSAGSASWTGSQQLASASYSFAFALGPVPVYLSVGLTLNGAATVRHWLREQGTRGVC